MTTNNATAQLLPHLFRREFARMTAVLCRHFGLKHIEIAEDIVSEVFLIAAENWALKGIPDNPSGWLYTVAKNKTRDYLKRQQIFETTVTTALQQHEFSIFPEIDFTEQLINDSQLAMIFAVCNPHNAPEAQIALALQVLCGFSIEEIARAFLAKPETIKKRLQRAKERLRNESFRLDTLQEEEVQHRLETVQTTIYLLFNEGYFSQTSSLTIRKELCAEAIRLALVLTDTTLTNTPAINALLALMCYQSSRLDARTNNEGETLLFEEQDRSRWDQQLIDRGNYFLVNACTGNELSRYHIEAAIAYWHTTPDTEAKWPHILDLYNQLIVIVYSPITALNRAFALSRVYGVQEAIKETLKLQLTESSYYYALLGYLYQKIAPQTAIIHYQQAISLTPSITAKQTLTRLMRQIADK
ncbi:RNA polymerase sigma factor [Chitinophaga sp. Hz27]|uniref:RNA polymerase sigma factor n=1 Tax=Chitinophaga sp. Hz27 TaxID=3347169 RepID=UPI0035DB7BB2